ncbi:MULTISPECIES: GTP cyclohydrolase II [unclassified Streptomyces]|uniref:GTP cyclohydrolase II n=1 Tax=unclassified Streptomyces TaxID=2593676 RepID=UPI00381EFCF9
MTDPDADVAFDDAALAPRVVRPSQVGVRVPTDPARIAYVERVVEVRLPTAHGVFLAVGYLDRRNGIEQVALVHGEVAGQAVLTRVHSECLTGDAFASTHCECGGQLSAALEAIVAEGSGILVYLQGHEGRGIGLLAKLRAMKLQEDGLDTVDANLALGLPVDAREYGAAAGILQDLGVRSVRLLSNNPRKREALTRHGVTVTEQVPLLMPPGTENIRYLRTKRERLDHDLPHLEGIPGLS